jgi:hypothetical protein
MGNAVESPVNEPSFDVVHPVSRRPVVARTSNADLPALTGKKIALVWDYVFRGDDVFRLVKERFHAERSGVEFVDHEVFGDIHGHDELLGQLPSRLEEMGVDAAIVATGA